jgi:sugar lactone lactonase YvrE
MCTRALWLVQILVLPLVFGCTRKKEARNTEPQKRPATSTRESGAKAPAPRKRASARPAPPTPPTGPWLSLLAGTLHGAGNVDGSALEARFDQPCDAESDGRGNVYIADSANHTIRRLELASGIVTTLAGKPGEPGGADGAGDKARFLRPCGLASDHERALYVADTANHTIRKIDTTTGAVTTVAGSAGKPGRDDGVAPAARFASPEGLVVDRKRDLYVADSANNVIRRIALATATVTTVAGTAPSFGHTDDTGPRASFFSPKDVTSDQNGNLYVSDQGNGTIRRVVIATGAVSTLAGTAGQKATVDGRGSTARFGTPHGIVHHPSGALFVADTTIRKVDVETGEVTSIAGAAGGAPSKDGVGAAAGFDAARGITLDGESLFVTELWKARLREVDISTRAATTLAGPPPLPARDDGRPATPFAAPFGVAADPKGHLFIADANANSIERVDARTGKVETVAGTRFAQGRDDGERAAARFYVPIDLVYENESLFVTDAGNNTIRKIDVASGKVTTLAGSTPGVNDGPRAKATFDNPRGIARDGRGHLYVADSNNATIRKIVIATGIVSTLAGSRTGPGSADGSSQIASFRFPTGLAVDESFVYVADTHNHAIRRVALSDGEVTTLAGKVEQAGSADGAGEDARFKNPEGLALDKAGHLFVADGGNHAIRKIALASGTVTTVVGSRNRRGVKIGALPASLNAPKRLALLPSGELVISDELALLRARF